MDAFNGENKIFINILFGKVLHFYKKCCIIIRMLLFYFGDVFIMSLEKKLFWIGIVFSTSIFGFNSLKQPKNNFSHTNQTQSHKSRTNAQLSKNEFLYTKALYTLLCHKVNQEKIKNEGLPATITHITNMLIQKHPEKTDSFLYYHEKYNQMYYQVNDSDQFINYLRVLVQPQHTNLNKQSISIQKIHTYSGLKLEYNHRFNEKICCR